MRVSFILITVQGQGDIRSRKFTIIKSSIWVTWHMFYECFGHIIPCPSLFDCLRSFLISCQKVRSRSNFGLKGQILVTGQILKFTNLYKNGVYLNLFLLMNIMVSFFARHLEVSNQGLQI